MPTTYRRLNPRGLRCVEQFQQIMFPCVKSVHRPFNASERVRFIFFCVYFMAMGMWVGHVLSMIVVGALWGCTNPYIRKASVEAASTASSRGFEESTNSSFLWPSLKAFLNVKVWLPFALNQSGSLVFYMLLAHSDLSMAVPVCNAMALVFSFGTSSLLGEPIEKPFQTALGASLVLAGVTICVSSQEEP
jgi:Putative transmembrane family 234